jgi:hypothetical protein
MRLTLTLGVTVALVVGVVRGCTGPGGPGDGGGRAAGDARPAAPRPLPPSPPTELVVRRMVIQAPVMRLGLDAGGHLSTPPLNKPRLVGWYGNGPSPGEKGTAVIVGHRDTTTGPAIFLNLTVLHRGDHIDVTRADRRTAQFTVDRVHTYGRAGFPSARIYGSTGRPELRLLTCGGHFDRRTGYSANVVVFAHLTKVVRG